MNSMFTKIVRIFLGIILVLSGLNKLFEIVPTPAGNLIESFGQVDYIFPVVAVLEILIGAMLLAKKWIAFALILLAPIAINILLFHFYLNFSGIVPAIVIATLTGILIYKHWSQYKPLFN
ncbi:putative membrane protein YphA (DoxX/SURF4 family) [Flavobacterium arsenatis]|uniref:Membrane protein YphA (DoxX/SURF4 family) n=1 Tax=Flavobacterium arsenatis TaxID=1484332 RepID=A0ABU1TRZ6_9FLAO|nr:DoxX family membrane protein [Flavobacterium arsenatis]MDR6968656.1 putative membrane protein YphA (DoxX/SURF4 family) [Flavobacterium arsenatis]